MASDVKQLGTYLKTDHATLMDCAANDWQDIASSRKAKLYV